MSDLTTKVPLGRVLLAFRWAAVLPSALLAAIAANWVVVVLNRLTFAYMGIDSASFLSKAFLNWISGVVFGCGFVVVAARVAPSRKAIVSLCAGAFGLLLGGGGIIIALQDQDYWNAGWAVAMAVGFGAGAFEYGVGPRRHADE